MMPLVVATFSVSTSSVQHHGKVMQLLSPLHVTSKVCKQELLQCLHMLHKAHPTHIKILTTPMCYEYQIFGWH